MQYDVIKGLSYHKLISAEFCANIAHAKTKLSSNVGMLTKKSNF